MGSWWGAGEVERERAITADSWQGSEAALTTSGGRERAESQGMASTCGG